MSLFSLDLQYGTVTRFTDNNGRTVARLNRDPSGMARTFCEL